MSKGLRKATALSLCAALASQVTAVSSEAFKLQSRQEDPCVDPEAVWSTVGDGAVFVLGWLTPSRRYNLEPRSTFRGRRVMPDLTLPSFVPNWQYVMVNYQTIDLHLTLSFAGPPRLCQA